MRISSYRKMPKLRLGDNHYRVYEGNPRKRFLSPCGRHECTFEEFLINSVKKAHEEWLENPVAIDADYNPMFNEDGTPILEETIWDKMELPDSKFYKRHKYNWRVRVPKLTRSNREWLNFYVTFPSIAEDVITGKERYSNGAKLKWIPLFTKIVEQVWPKETQYQVTQQQIENGIANINFYRNENIAYHNIGKKVEKYSGKPFKSHLWVNTIKGIDYMEVLSKGKKVKRVCYTFEEDDSKVCVERCKVIEK